MTNYYLYEMPVGTVVIIADDTAVTGISFGKAPAGAQKAETQVIKKAAAQFGEYFRGERKAFDLPLSPRGTEFQKKVWDALVRIPYGETRTYGQIAAEVGNPKASRAVGLANNRNPLAIIVPCHRVVGANGTLTGYAGGLGNKQLLLDLERRHK